MVSLTSTKEYSPVPEEESVFTNECEGEGDDTDGCHGDQKGGDQIPLHG